jgi:hypothetical protein
MGDVMGDVHFRGGVFSTAGNDVGFVFFDPKSLDRSDRYSAANIQIVRDAIENTVEYLGQAAPETEIKGIIDKVLDSAPAATRISINLKGVDPDVTDDEIHRICFVAKQDWYSDSKNELAQIISGVRSGRLKPIPGTDAIWDQAVGAHEGRHCAQLSVSSTLRDVITKETGADLQALKWLKENGHNTVAQAFVDYRVLTAVHSGKADHASGLALIANDVNKVTDDYVKAAEQMRLKVLNAVSNEHGLGSERNALRMVEYNPGRFIRTVERALDRGEFRGPGTSPDLEAHVKAYIEAFRRQVNGITPPVPSGARASVDLENGTKPNLTIGGVTAPEFFASIADPALAQAAVASNDAVFADASVRAPAENPDTPKVAGMKVA